MLVLGIMDGERVAGLDTLLLMLHIGAVALMFARIAPERMTPRRELFGAFVGTFTLQMALLLFAFWRAHPTMPQQP